MLRSNETEFWFEKNPDLNPNLRWKYSEIKSYEVFSDDVIFLRYYSGKMETGQIGNILESLEEMINIIKQYKENRVNNTVMNMIFTIFPILSIKMNNGHLIEISISGVDPETSLKRIYELMLNIKASGIEVECLI